MAYTSLGESSLDLGLRCSEPWDRISVYLGDACNLGSE